MTTPLQKIVECLRENYKSSYQDLKFLCCQEDAQYNEKHLKYQSNLLKSSKTMFN